MTKDHKRIFLVVGSENNFKRTIKNSVYIDKLYKDNLIDKEEYSDLIEIYPNAKMHCWGFQDNRTKKTWEKMNENDLCLMYQDKKIVMSGLISYKFKNAKVAKEIWEDSDKPFEYIFCFKDVHLPNLPSKDVLVDEFNYSAAYIMGANPLGKDKLERVIKKYGSVDNFRKHIEKDIETKVKEEETEKTYNNITPNIWWVNQGKTMNEEKEEGVLWAPIENKNGSNEYHWETMKEVEKGDIIIHYANGYIRYVSKVEETAIKAKKSESIRDTAENWQREGRLIKTNYYKLDPPVELELFNDEIVNLEIDKGPINRKGRVNQGYLFYFTKNALKIIQRMKSETNWPDFTKIEGENVEPITNLSPKDIVVKIKNYIKAKGFTYPDEMIENFYLSLKTKPFVLLAGISGTGKTKLVQLFAEAIGCSSANNQFKLISVKPDWNDSSDLLGYSNIRGDFQAGPIIKIIKDAIDNPDQPHIVCLDEMNLARVEYYFSEFLSKMETRRYNDNKIITDKLLTKDDFDQRDEKASDKYSGLFIPQNLYIVGTVNMDETTHPFSKKVLDRANTIEFNEIELKAYQENNINQSDLETISVNNDFLVTEHLNLKDTLDENEELVNEITTRLTEINDILKEANLQVGYRIRDEINFYIIEALENEILDLDTAFDKQLMQKVLPRIQGSSRRIKNILVELYKYTSDKDYTKENGDLGQKMLNYYNSNKDNIKYPSSSEKISYMVKRYEEDGFTAYWL